MVLRGQKLNVFTKVVTTMPKRKEFVLTAIQVSAFWYPRIPLTKLLFY